MLLILEGRVAAGFGVAREHLAPVADLICRRTGLPSVAPGTLNVRLGAPYRFEPDAEITALEHGFERLKLKRCCVRGVRAVILRPETHECGNGHGDAYLELVAAVHLRTALRLRDDDLLDVVTGRNLDCWAGERS
jgi:CTP-dependent riboflavin kinase